MKCAELICANIIVVDHFTRRMSAFNILDDMINNTFPNTLPLMVYLKMEKEDGDDMENDLLLEILLDSTIISKSHVSIVFDDFKPAKTIVNLAPFPIPLPGKLSVLLRTNDGALLDSRSVQISSAQPVEQMSLPLPETN